MKPIKLLLLFVGLMLIALLVTVSAQTVFNTNPPGSRTLTATTSGAPQPLLVDTNGTITTVSNLSITGTLGIGSGTAIFPSGVGLFGGTSIQFQSIDAPPLFAFGLIVKSNAYPAWPPGTKCASVFWMSNATLYVICTNSINSSQTTNKLGGL